MMLVDIGNMRIKWAQYRDGALSGHGAAAHAAASINKVLADAWQEFDPPTRVVAVNVAGAAAAAALTQFCQQHWHVTPEYLLSSARACGVSNGYHDPAQLGADRWAAVIGACRRHGGPACVIDCGTAMTVDTVTHDGQYLGGLIAPGLRTMRRALAGATVGLPDAPGERIELYARDTRTAIASGVAYAAVGFIERTLSKVRLQFGDKLKVLLSGGDAERMHVLLGQHYILAPHLVLEGMAVMAEQQA